MGITSVHFHRGLTTFSCLLKIGSFKIVRTWEKHPDKQHVLFEIELLASFNIGKSKESDSSFGIVNEVCGLIRLLVCKPIFYLSVVSNCLANIGNSSFDFALSVSLCFWKMLGGSPLPPPLLYHV